MSELLNQAIDKFIDRVRGALDKLTSTPDSRTPQTSGTKGPASPSTDSEQATLEALNIVRAIIACDERLTDTELSALITCFGPRLTASLDQATPAALRGGYFSDAEKWLDQPSPLFELLVAADRKHATFLAGEYYEAAMELAYATCSLDFVPSEVEVLAVDRLRRLLRPKLGIITAVLPATPLEGRSEREKAEEPEAETLETEDLDSLLAELDRLTGLDEVKKQVKLVTDFLRMEALRKAHELPVTEQSRHLVFTGNPGTGKTTIARLLARIYRALSVVDKGQLIETDRAGLVAGYIGQTAKNVTEVFNSALGGVLLIDEAYALARGGENDFGKEAIDTLVKLVEDHRSEVVVIVAGYPAEMKEFIDANPGLSSRFPKTIEFPDYSTDELCTIFQSMCSAHSYVPSPPAKELIRRRFEAEPRGKGFGNARLARNVFEEAVARQASRVVRESDPSPRELMALTREDVETLG